MAEVKKVAKELHKCKEHSFIMTASTTRGGITQATQLRCAHCLMPVNLEQLESKEWKEANNI